MGCAVILSSRAHHPWYVHGAVKKDKQDTDSVPAGGGQQTPKQRASGKPLDFKMTFTLRGKIRRHYAREQWNRLSWFASKIALPVEAEAATIPHATYLEFCLAYVCCNGRFRFHSGVGFAQKGTGSHPRWNTSLEPCDALAL